MSYYIDPQNKDIYFLQTLGNHLWGVSYELVGLRYFRFDRKKPRSGSWWVDDRTCEDDVVLTIPVRITSAEEGTDAQKLYGAAASKAYQTVVKTTITAGPAITCFNPDVFRKKAGLEWWREDLWFVAAPAVFEAKDVVFFDGVVVGVAKCRYPNKAEADRILAHCGIHAEYLSVEEIDRWCDEVETEHDRYHRMLLCGNVNEANKNRDEIEKAILEGCGFEKCEGSNWKICGFPFVEEGELTFASFM